MSDSSPHLTVVVSSHNHISGLRRALDSILSQEGANPECIVVDAGSTDGSIELLREYGKRLTWESVTAEENVAALSCAFNRGHGDLMWWLADTDKLTPWACRLVSFVFEKLPQVKWLTSGTPLTWTPSNLCVSAGLADGYARRAFFAGRNLGTSAYYHFPVWRSGTVWRRSLWEECGGRVEFPLEQAGDFELWMRCWDFAELYTMNIPLAGHQADTGPSEPADYWQYAADHLARRVNPTAPSRAGLRAKGQLIRRFPSFRTRFAQAARHIWISPPTLECGVATSYIL